MKTPYLYKVGGKLKKMSTSIVQGRVCEKDLRGCLTKKNCIVIIRKNKKVRIYFAAQLTS
jgi:hypothetical protein